MAQAGNWYAYGGLALLPHLSVHQIALCRQIVTAKIDLVAFSLHSVHNTQ